MLAPLRLVPRIADPDAADAALVEAILSGLPPGGRVLVAGDGPRTAWLADALAVVDVDAIRSPLPQAAGAPLFAEVDPDGGYDVAVADLGGAPDGAARHALAAMADALAPHGRLLVQVASEPEVGARTLGAWVRLMARAGLVLCDLREPPHGGLTGTVFVCEPRG